MEPKFQSSFIPKGPIATSGTSASIAPVRTRTLFGFLAKWIFGISIILALGVFGYNEYLLYHIGTLGANLDAAEVTLQPDVVKQISHADARISATRSLLASHVALSQLFDFLESTTLKNVRFSELGYQSTDKGLSLSITGQAASYGSLKLESDALNAAAFLKSPQFSDFSLDPKGNVNFTYTALVDPTYILYKNEFSTSAAQVPTIVPVTAVASSTPSAATTTVVTASTTSTSSGQAAKVVQKAAATTASTASSTSTSSGQATTH